MIGKVQEKNEIIIVQYYLKVAHTKYKKLAQYKDEKRYKYQYLYKVQVDIKVRTVMNMWTSALIPIRWNLFCLEFSYS